MILFSKMQLDLLKNKRNKNEIDSSIQMLMVLPPQSIDIIPDKYKCLFTDINHGCIHYFPTQFKLSTFLKTQTWECIPMLPKVNLDVIRMSMNKVE